MSWLFGAQDQSLKPVMKRARRAVHDKLALDAQAVS